MTYTEKELDQFLHGISLSLLSKKSAQHWRYDEETAKEIEWLEVLERKVRADKADRKTEPTHDLRTKTHECVKDTHDKTSPNRSEKPNNCEDLQDWKDRMWAEAIVTEPTISKMEQVETMSCQECKHWKYVSNYGWDCEFESVEDCKYEPKDEPQRG